MGLLHNEFLQRTVGGTFMERWLLNVLSRVELAFLKGHKDKDVIRRIRRIRRERRSMLSAYEAFNIFSIARGCCSLPGALAEVGVYQGASARLLCDVKGDKDLHLFDTFDGLPKKAPPDRNIHKTHQYACSLESVRDYLSAHARVHFHPGLFPESVADVREPHYCFAHFDVDLYESTRACLAYFYPRMTTSGVMVSHDYSMLTGVKQAFTEYFSDKTEKPIELPTTQCMVIKV